MTYDALTIDEKYVRGDLYKKDGEFFIITDERDDNGFRKQYKVLPNTIVELKD